MAQKKVEKPDEKRERPQNKNLAPPFKKGCSGGPGRPRLSEAERAAREASRYEISEMWQTLKDKTVRELKTIIRRDREPAVKVAMAVAILKAIQKGELSELHKMYDRILGKPRQAVELSGPDGKPMEIDIDRYRVKAKEIIEKAKEVKQ